jgi:glycyl-tRNA synthetase beta chain
MADLLIELICEEIPARMQMRAAQDLEKLVSGALNDAGLLHGSARHFVAPRHLAVYIDDVAVRQEDVSEERRGPRADAPEQAIAGFLKSTGLARDALLEQDTPKGRFLFARIERKGSATTALLPDMITRILSDFPWPKSQRWGATRFRWVRPLHRVNVLFDGAALPGELDMGGGALAFSATSCGHYFEHGDDISLAGVASADDYVGWLRDGYVMVDRAERRAAIVDGASALVDGQGAKLRVNEGLIDEITGLVEWPHALFGRIEDGFMSLPDEVLEASIRVHQKYLTTEDEDGRLTPGFVVVSNRLADAARDDVILAGNQRVLRARLADAEFFWQEDRQAPLAEALPRLADIVFYEGLGSVHDKAARLAQLAAHIAPAIAGCDGAAAGEAARLAKADLVSGMVGEFPELQGIMGGYYAEAGGASAAVASAIRDHYRPQGPADGLPATPEGLAVSLADKIDSLVGFFGVGAKPTGSKDPFALRRAALGVIRIILESQTRLPLRPVLAASAAAYGFAAVDDDLLTFIRERLRVSLRDRDAGSGSSSSSIAHDVVAAALGDGMAEGSDDILFLAERADALAAFLGSDDGAGLVAGWRRAASILEAEEGKAKQSFAPATDPALFALPAETGLYEHLDSLSFSAKVLSRDELLSGMQALGTLRGPIDVFFDSVVVNDDDDAVRLNRLGLLAMVRDAMTRVADFTKLEG